MIRCGSLFRLALSMKAVRSEEIAYQSIRYIHSSVSIWPRRYPHSRSNQCGGQGSCPKATCQPQWLLMSRLGNWPKVIRSKISTSNNQWPCGLILYVSDFFQRCHHLSLIPLPCIANHTMVHVRYRLQEW